MAGPEGLFPVSSLRGLLVSMPLLRLCPPPPPCALLVAGRGKRPAFVARSPAEPHATSSWRQGFCHCRCLQPHLSKDAAAPTILALPAATEHFRSGPTTRQAAGRRRNRAGRRPPRPRPQSSPPNF